jgi:DNA-binding protein YbaB
MGVFDTLKQGKQMMDMRGQAMQLQKKLKEVKKSYKDGNCSVAFLGDGSIDYIEIDGEPRPDLVKLFNRGREDIQKEAAKKVVEEEGFSGLLKGLGGQ